jgi:hypothetical protein
LFYKKNQDDKEKNRKIVKGFDYVLTRFSRGYPNMVQPGFLVILHLINSSPISFKTQLSLSQESRGHGSTCWVEPSFKIVAFQMRCFDFSHYLGSWVWKVNTGLRQFLSRLHPSKLFVLKNEFRYFLWFSFQSTYQNLMIYVRGFFRWTSFFYIAFLSFFVLSNKFWFFLKSHFVFYFSYIGL